MSPLRLAAFTHVHRLPRPTGVGKHILHMTRSLSCRPDVELRVLAARDHVCQGRIPDENPLGRFPCTVLPLPRRPLEALWQLLDWPKLDQWCRGFDWVYSASDSYLPARQVRVCTTIHHLEWFDRQLPWYNESSTRRMRARMRNKLSRIARHSDVIFTVSTFVSRQLEQLFRVDPAKMHVVGNGVEAEYFDIAAAPCRPVDPPYVLVVGGLTQRKGGELTVAVAKRLARRMPDLRIRVAGRSEPNYTEAFASLANLTQMGWIEQEELPRLVRDAVAVLFLSRYECFGIPAVEAMAAGTPPVVARFGALPETVGDGGVVVNVDDPDAIADLLVSLARDDRERQRLSEVGRRRAERYTWARCASNVVERLQAAS